MFKQIEYNKKEEEKRANLSATFLTRHSHFPDLHVNYKIPSVPNYHIRFLSIRQRRTARSAYRLFP